ncbi:MAG TPA: FAD-dependent oxidoreductase [Solirubrobacteraceae bacterium]|nr:FAD-dependent oxidoreductase [Solirubrobacteraceae bacterium]
MIGSVRKRPHVIVAGGGVAALECMLALRALAGHVLELTLLTREPDFLYQPVTVAEAFGRGEARRYSISSLIEDSHATGILLDMLSEVSPDDRTVTTGRGEQLSFDALVVATGAVQRSPLPGALMFGGQRDVPALATILDDLVAGRAASIGFALTSAHSWPLPLYELALMTASHLRARGASGVAIQLVTPEVHPLQLFGVEVADMVGPLLAARGIQLRAGTESVSHDASGLMLASGDRIPVDRVVTLPVLDGRPIGGLPHDARGFLPVDDHGRVDGLIDIYAAGDVTAFPVKQGGLAAQQADAVAEMIAAEAGTGLRPRPFTPVLRGLLLTGGAPLYLRSELRAERQTAVAGRRYRGPAAAAGQPLWWPPAKIAGRYLAAHLATARPKPTRPDALEDRSPIPGASISEAERNDVVELAVTLAECDARCGDYASALAALDTALVLNGTLPPELEAKRREWTAATRSGVRG